MTTSEISVNSTINLTFLVQQTAYHFLELSSGASVATTVGSPPISLSVEQVLELWLPASASVEGLKLQLEQAACVGQTQHCNATLSQQSARQLQALSQSVVLCAASSTIGPRITTRSVVDSTEDFASVAAVTQQVQAVLAAQAEAVCVATMSITASITMDESAAGDGTALAEALRRALVQELALPIDLVTTITYLELLPPPPIAAPSATASPPYSVQSTVEDVTVVAIVLPVLALIFAALVCVVFRRQSSRVCVGQKTMVQSGDRKSVV